MADKLKILIVDDSRTSRQLMVRVIETTDDMQVIGEAVDGRDAVKKVNRLKPDLVLMDIIMPDVDGLEATRQIMRTTPVPIVLITASLESYETDIAFKALRAGALTVRQKPGGIGDQREIRALQNTLRAMSEVEVIHHFSRNEKHSSGEVIEIDPGALSDRPEPKIVAIAASTGGPAALSDVLRTLPGNYPLPVVIVQHIASDFIHSLSSWFQTVSNMPITIAVPGEHPQPGVVYIAPGDAHLFFDKGRRFRLDGDRNGRPHMPSADVLFHSVAQSYGAEAIGVILTGMGSDGAEGMESMYHAGAFTIAQDKATSVVFGMPHEAIERRVVSQIAPINEVASVLTDLAKIRS